MSPAQCVLHSNPSPPPRAERGAGLRAAIARLRLPPKSLSSRPRYIYRVAPVSPDGCNGVVTKKVSVTMIWHVSYTKGEIPGIRIVSGRENAIDAACVLIGSGYEVSHIATNDAAAQIKAQE